MFLFLKLCRCSVLILDLWLQAAGEWTVPLKDKNAHENQKDPVEFVCTYSVKPDDYQWKLNGKPIDNDRITTSVDEDGTTFTLRITDPTYKDRGKYSCECNGNSTSSYLDVDGKIFKK